MLVFAISFLNIRTILSETSHEHLTVFWVNADFAADMAVFLVVESLIHLAVERTVKLGDNTVPGHLTVCNAVEILLDSGSETIVENGREIL